MIKQEQIQRVTKHFTELSEQYTSVLKKLSEEELNQIPFLNSWSAAQVVNHITKANNHHFLFAKGRKPERFVDERVLEFKEILLNYELKMESPDFILPDTKYYSKEESIEGIQNAFKQLVIHLNSNELSLLVETNSPLGSITKWEIANFIVFHSQRHLHQLKQISKTLKNKSSMENQNYTSTIMVDKTPGEAFNAIQNFRGWWSEQIEGNTNQLNETFFYHYSDVHLCKIKLIETETNKKLVYQIIENHFSFTNDKSEWTNTKLIFAISSEGSQTKIQFTHEGLVPEYECYPICNESWGNYINKSLYNLITTGKGNPNPIKGDGFNKAIVEKWKLMKN